MSETLKSGYNNFLATKQGASLTDFHINYIKQYDPTNYNYSLENIASSLETITFYLSEDTQSGYGKFTIPKIYDSVSEIFIEITLPTLNMNLQWIPNIELHIFKQNMY